MIKREGAPIEAGIASFCKCLSVVPEVASLLFYHWFLWHLLAMFYMYRYARFGLVCRMSRDYHQLRFTASWEYHSQMIYFPGKALGEVFFCPHFTSWRKTQRDSGRPKGTGPWRKTTFELWSCWCWSIYSFCCITFFLLLTSFCLLEITVYSFSYP